MKKYIGVKQVKAEFVRGYTKALDSDPLGMKEAVPDGYRVIYEDGYESWCPKIAFEDAYRECEALTFGIALELLKKGFKVARKGWNGNGMWIVLMPSLFLPANNTAGNVPKVNERTAKYIGKNKPLDSQPYIAMWTAQGKWQPGWVASQADILAEDWTIVE